jgi:1,4-dihydroxy-2-naphthoate octaprenyltransferase
VVIFFQGAWVFMANVLTFNPFIDFFDTSLWLGKGISASLIGTIYPITQIYQHEADRKDGVQTLSMLLGVKGTFVYCIALFVLVHVLMLVLAQHLNNLLLFQAFAVAMFPAALYFLNWFRLCIQNPAMANHTRTMQMLALSSVLVNLYFLGSLLFIL